MYRRTVAANICFKDVWILNDAERFLLQRILLSSFSFADMQMKRATAPRQFNLQFWFPIMQSSSREITVRGGA